MRLQQSFNFVSPSINGDILLAFTGCRVFLHYLLTLIGFSGFIVSDYRSVRIE